MKVRLTQIDGRWPNLALMRIAHYHRARGDGVHFTLDVRRDLFEAHYDIVYGSVIFGSSAELLATCLAKVILTMNPNTVYGQVLGGWIVTSTMVQGGGNTIKQEHILTNFEPRPLIAPYYGSGSGQTCKTVDQPLDTVTAKPRFGLVEPIAGPSGARADTPAPHDRIVLIDGVPHLLDIRFRMLEPYELARAMGFDGGENGADAYQFVGTKAEITNQIGNAVPVNTARALVSAMFDDKRGT